MILAETLRIGQLSHLDLPLRYLTRKFMFLSWRFIQGLKIMNRRLCVLIDKVDCLEYLYSAILDKVYVRTLVPLHAY